MFLKIIFSSSIFFSSISAFAEPGNLRPAYFDHGAKTLLAIASSPQYKAIFSNASAYNRGYEENFESMTYTGVSRFGLVTSKWTRGSGGRDIPQRCTRSLELINNVVVVGPISCVTIK